MAYGIRVWRAGVKRQLQKRPALTRKASGALRLFGAVGCADKLELIRSSAFSEIARIEVPKVPRVLARGRGFWMYSFSGADQIVRDISSKGWIAFEPPMPSVFAACLAGSGGVVLDVGANTGFYSLLAAHLSRRVTVHAFVPLPRVLQQLRLNVSLNGVGRRIAVFPHAVSDVVGEVELYVPPRDHGLIETNSSLDANFKESIGAVIPVPGTTLDAHVCAFGLRNVGMVKIDVEGLEHKVLAGASDLLALERPLVFLEILPRAEIASLEKIRDDHRYVGMRLRPSHAMVADVLEFDEQSWNWLLVPEERLASLVPILRPLGLSFTP